MELKLYDLYCTNTLRHRETARNIVQKIPKNTKVTLNFERIDFASRSFLHELLYGLSDRTVTFENRNDEVKRMMEIAKKGVIVC